jgi:hypothetical protein
MRHLTAAVAVAAIGLLVAGCDSDKSSPASSSTTTTTTTTTSSRPPVAQPALASFLLSAAELDGLLGSTGMQSQEKFDKPQDDNGKQHWPQGWTWPAECLYALGPAEGPVVADSKFTAISGDDELTPLPQGSTDVNPEVTQTVILFPSANEANDFFNTSSQRWPACANRQFTTPGDADTPELNWKVGSSSTADGILSTTLSMSGTKDGVTHNMGCQRALTIRNNVAIDVAGCRNDAGDLGVKVVNQIAAKVDKQ